MRDAQDDLAQVLDMAASVAGLDRHNWQLRHAGDAEFSVLPAAVSERRIVDDFIRILDDGPTRRSAMNWLA